MTVVEPVPPGRMGADHRTSHSDLVAWMAHDLRAPLACIRAMAEALEDGLAEHPTAYHRQIQAEVTHLGRMVDDLTEISQHAPAVRMSPERWHLAELVEAAVASCAPVAGRQQVRLRSSVPTDLVLVADHLGVTRVIANLVTNAVRHTPARGMVTIVGRARGS